MFVPGKLFQPIVMLVGKARIYPIEEPFKGRLLALHTNITLGWRGLPGTNSLAYYVGGLDKGKTFNFFFQQSQPANAVRLSLKGFQAPMS